MLLLRFDFPYLLFKMATHDNDFSVRYRSGVMSRWLLGDIDHLYLSIFKRKNYAKIFDSMPGRLRAICNFFKYNGRNCHFDVLRIDDIAPFFIEARQYIYSLFASEK